ncbi:MAG: hypothetical protein ACK53Y_10465, partial [bacterium]
KKYKVCWDDGQEQEVVSNCFLKELPFAALPPDIPPSLQQDNPELPPQGQAMADEEEEMIQDALLNHEEYEHLPGGPNESSGSSESEDESVSSDDSNDDIQGEEG